MNRGTPCESRCGEWSAPRTVRGGSFPLGPWDDAIANAGGFATDSRSAGDLQRFNGAPETLAVFFR
jgi:hypothetical protein